MDINADVVAFINLLQLLRSPENIVRSDAEKRYADACKTDPARVFACLASCVTHHDEVVRIQSATLLRRAALAEADPWHKATAVHPLALAYESTSAVRRVLVAAIAVIAQASPWSDLVPFAFKLMTENAEAAIGLLSEIMNSHMQEIISNGQELVKIVNQGLSSKNLAASTIVMISEMVQTVDGTETMKQIQQILPKIEDSLRSLTDTGSLSTALQSLIVLAEHHPTFFKPRYQTWIDLMLEIASASSLDPEVRLLSFEWVSTLTAATKGLLKVVTDFPIRVLSVAFLFLCEVGDDDESDDGLHKEGEAKVDFFVKKLSFKVSVKPLMTLTARHVTSNSWQERVAAAMAIRASGEYADEDSADQMAEALQQLLRDNHQRVRFAAFFALGQLCHDRSSNFHERWCDKFMPVLMQGCNDTNVIAVKAISALEAHFHGLSEDDIRRFSDMLIPILMQKLQSTDPKIIIASLEAIGALAISLDDGFDSCYDALVPLLLRALTGEAEKNIREKAFECISLTGFAVSKEKFAPAAATALNSMFANTKMSQLSDCNNDAIKRICKVLGKDFAVFLPHFVPPILQALELDDVFSTDIQGENEDDLVVAAENTMLRVKTGQLTEMVALLNLLEVFMKCTAEGYLDFVHLTSAALAKLLCYPTSSDLSPITSELRDALYPCWAELVGVSGTQGSLNGSLVSELVQNFVDQVGSDLVKADEADEIASMASGIVTILHRAGIGTLRAEQVQRICELAVAEINQSFQRDGAVFEEQASSNDPPSTDSETDDEHKCRNELLGIITACMKADARAFIASTWPTLQILLQQWFSSYGHLGGAKLALHLASDICQHLGEEAVALLTGCMDQIIKALNSRSKEERHWAAFTVNFAARSAAFAPFASRAVERLKGQLEGDGEIAALIQLCLAHPTACADIGSCWALCLEALPLKAEISECCRLNKCIFAEVQAGSLKGLLAARALGYLCEVSGNKELCDEELQTALSESLKQLPEKAYNDLFSVLTSAQQKKLQRIVTWPEALFYP
eukprot:symbB.v1.2.025555.t1/scaffold2488.1/size77878/6